MATRPMSGLVCATTSAKNSYREHSASSQIMSIPNNMLFSDSRWESLGSTMANRRTLLMLTTLLRHSRSGPINRPAVHLAVLAGGDRPPAAFGLEEL